MGTRHKHYDVIIAWANGAEVQRRSWCDEGWEDSKNPMFSVHSEYRIKPNRVKKEGWVNVYKNQTVGARIHPTEQDALKGKSIYDWVSCTRIEWEEEV